MSVELSQNIDELLDDYVNHWHVNIVSDNFIYFFEEHKKELESKSTWTEIKQTIEVEIIRRKKLCKYQQKEEKAIRDFYWDMRMFRENGYLFQRR